MFLLMRYQDSMVKVITSQLKLYVKIFLLTKVSFSNEVLNNLEKEYNSDEHFKTVWENPT